MYILVYIKNTIKYGYKNLINVISNYFYKKNIKKYSNNCNTYISDIVIKKNCLDICIKNLVLNKTIPFINKIKINKFNILLFPNKYIVPFSFVIFNTIFLEFKDIYEFNLKSIPVNNIKIKSNLDKKINLGLDKLARILKFITDKQQYLIKNFIIKFFQFKINCKNFIVKKNGNKYILNSKLIILLYSNFKFIKITEFNIYFDKYINIIIKDIIINIDDKFINLKEIYEIINKLKIIVDNDPDSEIKLHINKITIKYNNINNYNINIINIDFKNNKLLIENIVIKSFLKEILTINTITINLIKFKLKIENIFINLYKSLGNKLKISLSKYIKKTNIKNKNFKFLGININKSYIRDIVNKKSLPFGLDYIDLSPNNIEKSFLITDSKKINIRSEDIHCEYIKTNIFLKYYILVNKFNINFFERNKIIVKWVVNKFEFNYSLNKNIYFSCNDWLMVNSNNIILQKKLYKNSSPLLVINYTQNKLNITFSSIYLNIEPEIYIGLYNIIHQNIEDINKMFFHNYSSNYIDSDFFIKYLYINNFNIKLFYYPKNCSYYSILFGNLNEIYRTINYENINLKPKKIELHYPYNFSEMFKKIFKIWINDIYKNQLNNIILGTKFSSTINNTPVIFTKNILLSLKKLYTILNEMSN